MTPLYFGSSQNPLFGIYHPAQSREAGRGGCIVLCYPLAHEYAYVHRAFQQLAARLSRTGFHVFRFDYYGFGDSAGDSEESTIGQWIDDISMAIEEAKSMSFLPAVSLIGLRLGAAAAALAAARRNDVENLVLWEPVVSGAKYIKELFALHANWVSENLPVKNLPHSHDGMFEIMGMPFTPAMHNSIEKIDLLKVEKPLAKNILVVESGKHSHGESFNAVLKNLGDKIEYNRVPAANAWNGSAGMDSIYVPGQTLNSIVSWMSTVNR